MDVQRQNDQVEPTYEAGEVQEDLLHDMMMIMIFIILQIKYAPHGVGNLPASSWTGT